MKINAIAVVAIGLTLVCGGPDLSLASACQYASPGPLGYARIANAAVVTLSGSPGATMELPSAPQALLWCQEASRGLVSYFDEEALITDLVDANLKTLHRFAHETVLIDDGGFAYALGPILPEGRGHPFAHTRIETEFGKEIEAGDAPSDFNMAWQYALAGEDWLYVLARESSTEITRRLRGVMLWTYTIPESVLLARTNGSIAADAANLFLSIEGFDDRRPRVIALNLATGRLQWERVGAGPDAGFCVLAPLPMRRQLLIVTTIGPIIDLVDAGSGDVAWNWAPDCRMAVGPFLRLEARDDVVLLSDCLSPTIDCTIEPRFGAISIDVHEDRPVAEVRRGRMKLDIDGRVVTQEVE